MTLPLPSFTRTDPILPSTTLFRSDQRPVPGREGEPALQVDHAESGRAAGQGRVGMRLAVAARHAPAITETGEQRAEILAFHIDFQVRARGQIGRAHV